MEPKKQYVQIVETKINGCGGYWVPAVITPREYSYDEEIIPGIEPTNAMGPARVAAIVASRQLGMEYVECD